MKKLLTVIFCLAVWLPLMAQDNAESSYDPFEGTALKIYPVSNWRVALDFGGSYSIAKAADGGYKAVKDFNNKMRFGYTYAADVHGFFGKTLSTGFGGKFLGHHYSHSVNRLSNIVNHYYLAPSFVIRAATTRKRNAWLFGVTLGYVSYKKLSIDHGRINNISKGGLGSSLDLGYDIRLLDNTFLGFKLSFFGGIADLGLEHSESLSTIDFGMGLRF